MKIIIENKKVNLLIFSRVFKFVLSIALFQLLFWNDDLSFFIPSVNFLNKRKQYHAKHINLLTDIFNFNTLFKL